MQRKQPDLRVLKSSNHLPSLQKNNSGQRKLIFPEPCEDSMATNSRRNTQMPSARCALELRIPATSGARSMLMLKVGCRATTNSPGPRSRKRYGGGGGAGGAAAADGAGGAP